MNALQYIGLPQYPSIPSTCQNDAECFYAFLLEKLFLIDNYVQTLNRDTTETKTFNQKLQQSNLISYYKQRFLFESLKYRCTRYWTETGFMVLTSDSIAFLVAPDALIVCFEWCGAGPYITTEPWNYKMY